MPQQLEGKHQTRRVIAAFMGEDWAIEERKFQQMVELLALRHEGLGFTREEVEARIGDRFGDQQPGWSLVDGVAVIPVQGTLAPRMNMMTRISGGTSMQQLATWVREAADHKDVRAIVLDVDSPGGTVAGTAELADVVRSVRGVKPVKAVATNMMASAAYWIGSAADEIIASPSAVLGSIGVYGIHWDESQANENAGLKATVIRRGVNKGLSTGVEPLTKEGRAVLQEGVDDAYAMFVSAVATQRGVSAKDVEERFGQGKTMLARRAVEAGMADREGTLDQVVRELRGAGGSSRSNGSSAQATGVSDTPPGSAATTKEENVNAELKAALVNRGLIAADASDATAGIALLSFCTAVGVNPQDEAAATAALQAAPTQPKTPTTPPKPDSTVQAAHDEQVRLAELTRIEELEAKAELLGEMVSKEMLAEAKKKGWSPAVALDNWTKQAAKDRTPLVRPELTSGLTSWEKFSQGAQEAMGERIGLASQGEQAEGYANGLRGMSLCDLARESLRMSGVRVEGLDKTQIIRASLKGAGRELELVPRLRGNNLSYQTVEIMADGAAGGGYNRPGDFPYLMSNLMGRMLMEPLPDQETTYNLWTYRLPSLPDFRPQTIIELGGFGQFPLHEDGKKFEGSPSPAEEANWIQVDSYGDEWSLTPKMMIDDDLSGFARVPQQKQYAWDRTLNQLNINTLVANPTMPDGMALFHATHLNLVAGGSGGVPQQSQLKIMRKNFRKQTAVNSQVKLNQRLWALLIPEDIEEDTERALDPNVTVVPTAASSGETFRGKVKWFVDAMLGSVSAAEYYAFANPAVAQSICWATQTGYEGLRVRMYYDPTTNCLIYQFEGRAASIARTHRGVQKNAGA